MEKVTFQTGDIILFEGLYRCGNGACEHSLWGVAGRRLPRLSCGHEGDWQLVRRRMDPGW
jgi:hypothetical protein